MHTGKYSYCSINRSIQSHPGDVTVGGGGFHFLWCSALVQWEILCTQRSLANSWIIYHLCPTLWTSLFPYRQGRTLWQLHWWSLFTTGTDVHYKVCWLITAGEVLFNLFKSSSNLGLMVNLSSQTAKSVHISQIPRKIQRGKWNIQKYSVKPMGS